MLEDKRVDERIFQMLRGVIQHYPRITILMSGAHTLEELPPLWSNYFINTKMLKVGPLEEADAIELITRPIEDFPLKYDEDALEMLLRETGCHPNWLQFTCREVEERLNDRRPLPCRPRRCRMGDCTRSAGAGGRFQGYVGRPR